MADVVFSGPCKPRLNHNREVVVLLGQEVAVGEQIAAVGATGWATGPHLDNRIEMGGELIDPLRLDWTR